MAGADPGARRGAARRCRTRSTTRAGVTPSSVPGWRRCRRCRKRCRSRTSSSRGSPSTASSRSRACGRGSGSSPAGKSALEAALRERLGALEVGRLDSVRAFAADAPPSRLAFFTAPAATHPSSHHTLPRLADLLHLGDAGLAALLGDWLEGVYTASDFDAALAARSSLTHGEVIMTREGHAVSQFAVAFYAPDSEQAGLLARAQEIENLRRQTRAQALVGDESRSRLIRAEAESTEAAAHLANEPARGGAAAVARPPAACRAAAPLPAGRADEPAPRAARRRARRARGRACRARRAAARKRVALRGARQRARRRPGAAGDTRRGDARRKRCARRRACRAARARASRPGDAVRAALVRGATPGA